MTTARQGRPLPARTPDTEFWWAGAEAGELRIQRCAACGHLQHPPEPACMSCHAGDMDGDTGGDLGWIVSAGRGQIYSFVVYHEPRLPGFSYPYTVAVVELDEGTRVITDIVDADPGEVGIGQRVRVSFRRVDERLTLPVFTPEPR